MPLSRRSFLAALGATAGAAALGGCGGGGGEGGGGGGLTLSTWGSEQEVAAFRSIGEAFRAETGTPVEVEVLPFDQMRSTMDARLQAGEAPDLFRVTYTEIGGLSATGALADLSGPLGDGFGDAFVPALWASVLYEGAPVGVPHHTDTSAFVYNVAHFANAGITEFPQTLDEAWSWEEFIELMERVGAANPDASPFAANWQLFGAYRWFNWLHQAGGSVYDEALATVTIDTPEARKALEYTQGFYTSGLHAPNLLVRRPAYPDEVFPSGQISAAYMGDFLIPGLVETVGDDFEFGATFLPRDVNAASDLGGNAVVVTAESPKLEAAAAFAAFLVNQENMRAFCEQTTVLPVRTDLVDAELDYQVRPDLMPVFQQQATTIPDRLVQTCVLPQFAAINDALVQELEACFGGGQSVDDTLANLQTAIEGAAQ